ncbi:MAG: hypothetical protein QM221_09350 [Bacillota bacterium]|jgi:hypothetical protein|nr:hypothetical protein [Bacillota bacterium]
MKERDSFYANGMTLIINDNEALIRFMRKVPVFGEDLNVAGETVEEAICIIMPASMMRDFPGVISQYLVDIEGSHSEIIEDFEESEAYG